MSSGAETRDGARPVVVAVDDEPSVARAVERDLRRRYGRDYRVLRAESGADALAAVRESKLRGEPRSRCSSPTSACPRCRASSSWSRRCELAPEAKRVLLTAYADTQAAIDAINRVSLDHYLLKPWDPPEEQLYPVVDDLLDAWRADAPADADRHPGGRPPLVARVARGPRLPGAKPGAVPLARRRARREAPALLAAAGGDAGAAARAVPRRRRRCRARPCRELAERAGVRRRAELEFYDLVIVGGGPAGLAAAVYGASEGLRTAAHRARGAGRPGRPELAHRELPRLPGRALSGADLARRATAQAPRFGAEML